MPTTHIFEPPIPGLMGQVENEYFCLRLASAFSMNAVNSQVMAFGAEQAIVLERYDRLRQQDGQVGRLHQEDMCQALKLNPGRKYLSDGGPGLYDVVTKVLLPPASAVMDRALFVQAASLNYVLVGTDAHAKNFSILFGRGGDYRLAPIYDVVSYLPYAHNVDVKSLSMSVAGQSIIGNIRPHHWREQAKQCGLPTDIWVASIRDVVARAPDLASDTLRRCRAEALTTEVLDRLSDGIAARSQKRAASYGTEAI